MGASPQASAAVYRDEMDKAQQLVKTGNDAGAILAYQRAAEANPRSPSPWVGMENAYLRLRKYEEALAAARNVAQVAPDAAAMVRTAHYVAGVALLGLGDEKDDKSKYVEAEQELRMALEQSVSSPPVPVTRYYYGLALMKTGHREEAVDQWRIYLRENPGGMFAAQAQEYVYNGADDSDVDDPVLGPQLRKGDELVRRRDYEGAISEYKRAGRIRPDSAQPYVRLAETYYTVGAYKDCVEAARKASQLTANKIVLADQHNLAGIALTALADYKGDKNQYQEAEQELRTSVRLIPDIGDARFNLGTVLLKQGRDQDGIEELKRYLKEQPDGDWVKTAEEYVANPRRAREYFIPEFAVTTSQGEYLSTDGLQGKVLLLHFWGSWSMESRISIDEVQKIAKKHANDAIVVLSIGEDRDERIWRQFISDKKMSWQQAWDSDGHIARLFRVNIYPTYLVVGADGLVRRVQVGTSGGMEGEVKKALKTLPATKEAKPGL